MGGLNSQFVMYEEEFKRISAICDRLTRDANAKVVFLVDRNGQMISATGSVQNLDTTSLGSLVAGNTAATGGIAKLIDERDFPNVMHEGEHDNMYISNVGQRAILVVIFDQRSTQGLVKLRAKRAAEELRGVFEALSARGAQTGQASPIAEITDEDIDSLFN